MKLTVSHYQNTLLFAQYQDGGILYRGKYDVAYYAWGLGATGDFSPIYGCDEFPPSGQNSIFWCNAAAEKSMQALYGHYDQAQRNQDDRVVMTQTCQGRSDGRTHGYRGALGVQQGRQKLQPGRAFAVRQLHGRGYLMKKNTVARLCILLLSAALAAGCSKSGGPGVSGGLLNESPGAPAAPVSAQRVNSWTRPHVLRYATAEDVSSLNPTLIQQGTLDYMASMTMAWLIKWDAHNNAYGELATEVPTKENGGVSADGLTITYHIRKGVKWSDGVPFDADDVVWSFHAVLNPANNIVSRSGWDHIAKIDEPDKYTVVLHLTKPYSPFVETFFSTAGANPCLMPKHLLAKYPNINNVPYNALPVGIGPFKYKEWDRGQRVVMVANPLYFRGMPKLKEIDFEIIPDTNTVLTEMQAKELDLWYPVPASSFATKMQNMGQFAYIRQPGYLFNHIDFNLTRPVLKDPAVRIALRYATDRATLIRKISHGIGLLQEQPAPRTAPFWDPNLPLVPFDLAKANQTLDAAGWKRGADGIRSKNGVRLSLEFITNSGNPGADQQIEMIRTWWKQIGAEIVVKHYLSALIFASYADHGVLLRGNWDAIYFAWGVGATGDLSTLYACDEMPPNGQNVLHWCDPVADKAMHDLYTHYNQAQRNKDDAVLFQRIVKDVPTIVTNGREDLFVFNRDLENFHPNGVTPFDNMMNVDI